MENIYRIYSVKYDSQYAVCSMHFVPADLYSPSMKLILPGNVTAELDL